MYIEQIGRRSAAVRRYAHDYYIAGERTRQHVGLATAIGPAASPLDNFSDFRTSVDLVVMHGDT